jgi:large subunit ribosomal protein L31e
MSETELERVYTVPLSRAWIAPRHRRTKRAVNILKEYAEKHMKSSEIKIETGLNEKLWNRGITSPPRRITVKMSKDEDGVVTISLPKEKKQAVQEPEAPVRREAAPAEVQTSAKDSAVSKSSAAPAGTSATSASTAKDTSVSSGSKTSSSRKKPAV